LKTPFTSVQDVAQRLLGYQQVFLDAGDRRAIFATCYLAMTRTMEKNLTEGLFLDTAWVERYLVTFANLYRQALQQRETNDSALPDCWKFAFDTAASGSALVIQDLVLGINAHVNHDLALALQSVGIEPMPERHEDHDRVNQVLQQATKPVEDAISTLYAPGLGLLARALGPLGADVTNFSIDAAREHAWSMALALCSSSDATPIRQDAIRQTLDSTATVLAKLVLLPTSDLPFLVPLLKHLERDNSWLDVLRTVVTA
jgi:Family of unknown function (DUF5995)